MMTCRIYDSKAFLSFRSDLGSCSETLRTAYMMMGVPGPLDSQAWILN
jgi:hypothetical protein